MTDNSPSPGILADLRWRGLIHQTTDDAGLDGWLDASMRTVYAGFDPTADSLHVGHLMALMTLRRFQRAGHRPIALIGGATGMIGDPSGKSEERNLLSLDALRANVESIRPQMEALLDFNAGPQSAMLVNNHDWMSRFSYLEFLRDIGKNFPVSVMLAKDSVKSRLSRSTSLGISSSTSSDAASSATKQVSVSRDSTGKAYTASSKAPQVSVSRDSMGKAYTASVSDSGLSYTEFSYMLLQAYDFAHLNRQHGCELQIGGSDQWGNITAGIDLARRMHGVHLHGLTFPLLTKSDGGKMGKTESGAIWLSARRTSPYQFYQFWINVEDADAGKCLRFFTELSHDQIEALDAARSAQPEKRESQRRLAEEVTRLVHGQAGLSAAVRATEIFFGAEIDGLTDSQLAEIFADVPSRELPRARLEGEGMNIIDALVESGLAKSKGDARRVIDQGGAYVNNRRVEGLQTQLGPGHLASETVMVLRAGKKKYALLRFA